jgi:hypothetical protein
MAGGHEARASRRNTRAAFTAAGVLVAGVGDRHQQLVVAPQVCRRPAHAVAGPLPPPCQTRSEPPSERRTVRRKATRAQRGDHPAWQLHRRPGLVHAATVAKRQAPHPDRVRVAAASAALAAAECLRHGQWNSLDKG